MERRIIDAGKAGLAGQQIQFLRLQASITDMLALGRSRPFVFPAADKASGYEVAEPANPDPEKLLSANEKKQQPVAN